MYMVAILALRVLYVVALVYFAIFLRFSLLNPFTAMMSFAGYFHARFLLSAFFPVCLSYFVLFFPTVFVPDLVWRNFLCLVTTAGFVADQLIIGDKQQRVRLCVILVFYFHLSSSCDIGEPGMGSVLLLFHFWVVNPLRCSCVCIPHSFI